MRRLVGDEGQAHIRTRPRSKLLWASLMTEPPTFVLLKQSESENRVHKYQCKNPPKGGILHWWAMRDSNLRPRHYQ